jgi:hypothetical protein
MARIKLGQSGNLWSEKYKLNRYRRFGLLRWIKIKGPLVIVGGEMTMDAMGLVYSRSVRNYESLFQISASMTSGRYSILLQTTTILPTIS